MEKITKGHQLTQSPDFIKQNIEILKSLFPTINKEGKIDFDELRSLLTDDLETEDEYYRFTWAGKTMALREAIKPSTATLLPSKTESKNWNSTQNIFIEGDNLEVLKLLQKSYANKIQMIYIDPPYNTGKEFVYKDNYSDNLKNYLELTGQVDSEGRRLSTNTESDGRYHSNWLNMMYPRLKLAKNLLTEDGVIFISIDDNESSNLKKICDEIFGEDNFISQIIWEKRYGRSNDQKFFSSVVDYILLYRKSSELITLKEPRSEKSDLIYSNPDNDPRGDWTSVSFVSQRTKEERPNLTYTISNPNTGIEYSHPVNAWKYSKEKYLEMLKDNRFYWGKDGKQPLPRIKRFLSELPSCLVPVNLWKHTEVGTGEIGTKEVDSLIGNEVFTYPKPTTLLKKMLQIGSKEDSIVLDFFAGSGSTAHAVMELNSETSGARKFICVQLPEPTEEKSEAFKLDYKNIADIAKERIRKAGELILTNKRKELEQLKKKIEGKLLQDDLKQQIAELEKSIKTLDIGFKVFKLDSSNVYAWDGNPANLEKTLFNAASNLKENRTEDDLLYEILLKSGIDLSQNIVEKTISGKTVFSIGLGALLICLADGITTDIADGIGKWKQELQPATCKVIFKDMGFTDVEKTNSMQLLKRYGIEEVNTI